MNRQHLAFLLSLSALTGCGQQLPWDAPGSERLGESESGLTNDTIFNVVNYGADPTDDGQDDYAGIQAALDAAAVAGGVVYVPKGVYEVSRTLFIARTNRAISIVGEGRISSQIVGCETCGTGGGGGDAGLAWNEPVLAWTPTVDASSEGFRLANLHLGRRNNGYVLVHSQPTDDVLYERLLYCRIENVHFSGVFDEEANDSALVYLVQSHHCAIENTTYIGGQTGLHLVRSTNNSINDFRTGLDGSLTHGLRITEGGQHVLSNIRIDELEPQCSGSDCAANGLWLERTNYITIDQLKGEGKDTLRFVNIEGPTSGTWSSSFLFTNLSIPGPNTDAREHYGLFVGDNVRDVFVQGGTAPDFTSDVTYNNDKAIKVSADVENVHIEGLSHGGGHAQARANVAIDTGAANVYVGITAVESSGSGAINTVVAAGLIETMTPASGQFSVHGYERFAMSSGGSIHTLNEGYEGQQITILLDNGDTVGNSMTGNMLVAGGSWSPAGKATITLLFDGTDWREVARSVNF